MIFHLDQPDTTFQYVLTYPGAGAIVDEETFPADEKLADEEIVGSGPYKLSQYKAGDQAVLEANEEYTGDNDGAGAAGLREVLLASPSALKLAVENGEVDVAWRSLEPDRHRRPRGQRRRHRRRPARARRSATGSGSVDGPVGQGRWRSARRRPRSSTVRPSPRTPTTAPSTRCTRSCRPGFAGQKDAFKEKYGERRTSDAAKQILDDAGIKTPVELTVGWTPTHYGPNADGRGQRVRASARGERPVRGRRSKSAEWEQYQTIYKEGAYDLFILGWFPDFLDADNYLSPFIVDGGFFQNGYTNAEVNELVAEEQGSDRPGRARARSSVQLQDIAAEDVPFIPSLGRARTSAVYGAGMEGVEDTLDPSFIFRFWLVSKNCLTQLTSRGRWGSDPAQVRSPRPGAVARGMP